MRTTKLLAAASMVLVPPRSVTFVRVPVAASTSHAPAADTTIERSIPGEVRPAPAGQAEDPVAASSSRSSAHSAIGTAGSSSVCQSTRQ
jgi:hypothetical protein